MPRKRLPKAIGGQVVDFPVDASRRGSRSAPSEPCSIIVLPVVHVERGPGDPPRRRRRRNLQVIK